MTWLPEWRITVGDDVFTNVTSVSYSSGRLDIDRQPTAGYCRVEIINTTNAPFTINVTETIKLELKNSAGTYITVFGGEVSDFSIGVRSPEETGFITTGTILGIGSLARLTKAVYNTALAEGLDGAQIAAILNAALNLSWSEVTPTLTWATYPATTIWSDAESYIGTIDSGFYTMISQTASATAKSQNLVDQISNSALGQIYEDRDGNVNYDDQDHRTNYLALNGYTALDGSYANPSSIKSTTQTSRIRNSLIYKYGAAYGSTFTTSDATSIATYGLFEKSTDSNIKNLVDITAIGNRELLLRDVPREQLEVISFRLDNPLMPDALRNSLIASFFGQPVTISNLPANMLGGNFDGFVENITIKATPSYVDINLYVSAALFSLPANYGDYVLTQTVVATGNTTFTVPAGKNEIAVLVKAYGGFGANGQTATGNGAPGGGGGGGGGAAAFWNYPVTPGNNFTVNLDFTGTRRASFGSLISVNPGGHGSATTGGAGGGLFSIDPNVDFYTFAAGGVGGNGGGTQTANGNGNPGFNASGGNVLLSLPSNVGLPSDFRSGSAGGGGGGGAKASAFQFFTGGGGGNPDAGSGGNTLQDGLLNGSNAVSTINLPGTGGAGGGGGAFQTGYGNGNGGLGIDPSAGAIVYIYTR